MRTLDSIYGWMDGSIYLFSNKYIHIFVKCAKAEEGEVLLTTIKEKRKILSLYATPVHGMVLKEMYM